MRNSDDELTPRYARFLLGLTRPFPNFDVGFVKPLRARAVRVLGLSPGDRVLDAGCGMGGSFPYLVDAVGPSGEVLGIEISPTTVDSARRRIDANRWTNVRVLRSGAEEVSLTGRYDGLIMFAAPDVYASKAALRNLLPHLRDGARVVLFGAKRSTRRAGRAINPVLDLAVTRLSFATTPLPDAAPWRLVGTVLDELEIDEYFFGTMFLASGTLSQDAAAKATSTWDAAPVQVAPGRPSTGVQAVTTSLRRLQSV